MRKTLEFPKFTVWTLEAFFPWGPKQASSQPWLESLIALIILCNSSCFLCLEFYRGAMNGMVWLWLWKADTAHVVPIKFGVFLYHAMVDWVRFLISIFRKQGRIMHRGPEDEESERGNYNLTQHLGGALTIVHWALSTPCFLAQYQPVHIIQWNYGHMRSIETNTEQPGNNMTSVQ